MQTSLQDAKRRMNPAIAEHFDRIEGACDYFSVLERHNDRLAEQL